MAGLHTRAQCTWAPMQPIVRRQCNAMHDRSHSHKGKGLELLRLRVGLQQRLQRLPHQLRPLSHGLWGGGDGGSIREGRVSISL